MSLEPPASRNYVTVADYAELINALPLTTRLRLLPPNRWQGAIVNWAANGVSAVHEVSNDTLPRIAPNQLTVLAIGHTNSDAITIDDTLRDAIGRLTATQPHAAAVLMPPSGGQIKLLRHPLTITLDHADEGAITDTDLNVFHARNIVPILVETIRKDNAFVEANLVAALTAKLGVQGVTAARNIPIYLVLASGNGAGSGSCLCATEAELKVIFPDLAFYNPDGWSAIFPTVVSPSWPHIRICRHPLEVMKTKFAI